MVKQSAAKSYVLLALTILIIIVAVSRLPNPSAEPKVLEEDFEFQEEQAAFAGKAAEIAYPQYEKELSLASGLTFSYLSSYELDKKDESITRLVIVIHGVTRNAEGYFQAIAPVVVKENTVLIAPHFLTAEDPLKQKQLHWTSSGWKRGDKSTEEYSFRYSSFEILDTLITTVLRKLPKVNEIIVVGHSAGGQFVHRYAAGNQKEGSLRGVKMKYVVVNPSSYLYLNDKRWDEKSHSFTAPLTTTGILLDIRNILACPDYDEYAKGLQNLNAYMRSVGEQRLQKNLVNRKVVYLLGSADTGEAQLDTSCAAMLQGKDRFERGNIFVEHLNTFFPKNNALKIIVSGVGHNSAKMFQSAEGRRVLG